MIEICFRGVRGSHPVCGSSYLRYGGHTTCAEVRAGDRRIILDAGTGIVSLGNELAREHARTQRPLRLNLFFTHTHHDHIVGLPFFKPVYLRSTEMLLFGPGTKDTSFRDILAAMLTPAYHPLGLDEMGMKYRAIDLRGGEIFSIPVGETIPNVPSSGNSFAQDDLVIRVLANPRHPKLGVLHYRIECGGRSFVFATDVEILEGGDPFLEAFAEGANLLALDGMYTEHEYHHGTPAKQGWGHSTWKRCCMLAIEAGVERLAIIHHDPDRTDRAIAAMERRARALFPHTFFVRERQIVRL